MRKSKAKKRYLAPDPKFGNTKVTQFVNNLMWAGKKNTAFSIFYDAIDIVEKKAEGEETGLDLWERALVNCTPNVEVKSKRVGGSTFQIPVEIANSRKLSMGMKWLIGFSRKRNEKSMAQKLASEILAASKEEGASVKKKEDTHKMAEANKAFAHYRA